MRSLLLCVLAGLLGVVIAATQSRFAAWAAPPTSRAVEWVTPEVKTPRVSFHAVHSDAAAAFGVAEPQGETDEFLEAEHTLIVDGRERSFLVQAPARPDGPLPVVFVFHGGGGRGENMARNSFREMVAREDFLAVYPSGWKGNWNDGRDAARIAAQQESVDDVRFVRAIVDDLATRYSIDRTRVFATGASNGGIFAHYLAANAADLFAAIAPVIGGLAEPVAPTFRPSRPISLLVIQGDADPLVPIQGGPIARNDRGGRVIATDAMLALYLRHNRIDGAPTIVEPPDRDPDDGCRTVIHRYPPGEEGVRVEYWLIEGGGHTMPGSRRLPAAAREARVGRTSRDFDGLQAIWAFFKSCPPRAAAAPVAPAASDAGLEMPPRPDGEEPKEVEPSADALGRLDQAMQEAVARSTAC